MNRFGAMVGVLVLTASTALADLSVPLTVVDRAGYARVQEPVTSGVPLPFGLMTDTTRLALLGPDGRPVPAQFTVAARWYPDQSIRWVLVDFQADCPKEGKAVYTLTDRGGNPAPPAPVAATLDGNTATVTTGVLKFTVNRARFNLLHEVWVDPTGRGQYDTATRIVGGDAIILLSHCGTGLPVYKNFTPSLDPNVTLEVEENGPLRAVLKLTGRHLSNDDMPGNNHLLDFVCRIYAYAGSGLVRVMYSLECKQGATIAEAQPLDRMWFSFPLSLRAEARTWAVGLPGGKVMHPGTDPKDFPDWQTDLTEKPEETTRKYYQAGLGDCWVNSQDSKRVVYRGDFWRKREPVYATGKLDKKANVNVGWLDVADDRVGVMGGIRDFWQTYPRCLKTDGNDLIVMLKANLATRPDLLTRRTNARTHFYAGMCKTSEVMLYFHGPRQVEELMRVNAGLQDPLFAAAPPKWYCEGTRAFGRLASSDPALYDADTQKIVATYDAALRESLNRIMKFRDYEFGDYDSYGFFNYGDNIDYLKDGGPRGDPGDYTVTWDNCYYDYPRALMLQWARTGDRDFLDYGIQAQWHLMDVDMVCYHPDARFTGANRYCDGTMHIRQNQGIYVSDTFNHYKNQSHYMRFYLTGDRRSLEQGLLSTGFAMAVNGMSWGEPRSIGHGLVGVLSAYQATGDVKYYRRLSEFAHLIAGQVAKGTRAAKGRYWQAGIGIEGLREYYELTGDESVLAAVRALVDDVMAKKDWAESTLHGLAFIGYRQNVPDALARARTQIAGTRPINRPWGQAQSFGNEHRNSGFVFWYLAKDLAKDDSIKTVRIGE
jgi:hypothetical protein